MLIEERNQWKHNFENNNKPDSVILKIYRENRNTPNKSIPEVFEEVCAYALYLESLKKGNKENLNKEMSIKRDYWYDIFKDGSLPNAQILKDYRIYRDSNSKRTTRIIEELCEYILYLEKL